MSKSRRQFSPEEKHSILQEAEREGHSETCRKYNLAASVLAYWKRKYLAKGDWCGEQTKLTFIQKGKPHQDGYIERFNRTFREEVLDLFAFTNLSQARLTTQAWMWIYNNERPHSALGYLTPTQFLLKYGKLHHPQKADAEFTTFQQDSDYDWKSIVLNATN